MKVQELIDKLTNEYCEHYTVFGMLKYIYQKMFV